MNKILIFIDWFLPAYKAGGPVKSIYNMISQLNKSYEIYVYTSCKDLNSKEGDLNVIKNRWILFDMNVYVFYSESKNDLFKINSIFNDVQPICVYLNSMFSVRFSILVLFSRKYFDWNSRIVLAPRGMLKPSAMDVKRIKKQIYLRASRLLNLYKNVYFHATNDNEKKEIVAEFKNNFVYVVNNFPPPVIKDLKILNKREGYLKIVFIGRIHKIKNLSFLLSLLPNVLGTIQLSIVGDWEDIDYKNKCDEIVETFAQNIEVYFIKNIEFFKVSNFIEEHHLMILPTLGENYGHVIIESLSVGRPVLISNRTPWVQLDIHKAGYAISLDSTINWVRSIQEFVDMKQSVFNEWCIGSRQYAMNLVNQNDLFDDYLSMFCPSNSKLK